MAVRGGMPLLWGAFGSQEWPAPARLFAAVMRESLLRLRKVSGKGMGLSIEGKYDARRSSAVRCSAQMQE